MSRNNEKNIKKHNNKVHQEKERAKNAEMVRKKKLKQITKKFHDSNRIN